MAIEIEQLDCTVRVVTAARANLRDGEAEMARPRESQRTLLVAPPNPRLASGTAPTPPPDAHEPDTHAEIGIEIDPYTLADRVYQFLQYDAEIARERLG